MKRIFLVLGEGNVGKSTLVRNLTGIRIADYAQVEETGGNIFTMWAWMRSAQEAGLTPDAIVNEILRTDETNLENYLLPLRIVGISPALPGYDTYFSRLLASGIIIANSAILTKQAIAPTLPLPITPSVVVVNSRINAQNRTASIVRAAWNWI